jgi:redox-sensitive bicupin YhaK (pirin superfamily)
MWIMPARLGIEPSVEQRSYSEDGRRGRLLPVLVPAAGFGGDDAPNADGAVTVHQDAAVYAGLLEPGAEIEHRFRTGFGGYFFVVHGEAELEGGLVDEGGAARIADVAALRIRAAEGGAEVLLVETRVAAEEALQVEGEAA